MRERERERALVASVGVSGRVWLKLRLGRQPGCHKRLSIGRVRCRLREGGDQNSKRQYGRSDPLALDLTSSSQVNHNIVMFHLLAVHIHLFKCEPTFGDTLQRLAFFLPNKLFTRVQSVSSLPSHFQTRAVVPSPDSRFRRRRRRRRSVKREEEN